MNLSLSHSCICAANLNMVSKSWSIRSTHDRELARKCLAWGLSASVLLGCTCSWWSLPRSFSCTTDRLRGAVTMADRKPFHWSGWVKTTGSVQCELFTKPGTHRSATKLRKCVWHSADDLFTWALHEMSWRQSCTKLQHWERSQNWKGRTTTEQALVSAPECD